MWRCLLLLCFATSAAAGKPDPQRQRELRSLLKNDCGACHGLTRKGGLGPPLLPEALAGKSDAELLRTIQEGRPGTAMPPWKPFVDADETLWLIEELLRKQPVSMEHGG